jgi:hypothetical protein
MAYLGLVVGIKRKFIHAFKAVRDSSERFFIQHLQTRIVIHSEAVIINCNCKEVPINPIIKSRTHYY